MAVRIPFINMYEACSVEMCPKPTLFIYQNIIICMCIYALC